MNKLLSCGVFAVTLLLSACDSQPKQEPIADVIDRGLKASTESDSRIKEICGNVYRPGGRSEEYHL